MPYPNFIIAGPPKTGTTSLYYWLLDHPECGGPPSKETHFFADHINEYNKEANFIEHGLNAYSQLFEPYKDHRIILESTPGYIDSMNAMKQIVQLTPLPKLIFIYRDPVDRLWSEFVFFRYKLRSFNEDLASYVGWNGKHFSGKNFNRARSVDSINRWIDLVGENNITIFSFKDIQNRPKDFMKMICSYIQIDGTYYDSYNFELSNKTTRTKSLWLFNLAKILNQSSLIQYFPMLKRIYSRLNTAKLPTPTEADLNILNELRSALSDQVPTSLIKPIMSLK